MMIEVAKSSFFRLFATGFIAGALGMVAIQPAVPGPVGAGPAASAAVAGR